jgi:hypothetical protein
MTENTKLNSKLLILIQKPGEKWYTLCDGIRTSIKESGVIGALNQLKVILAAKNGG